MKKAVKYIYLAVVLTMSITATAQKNEKTLYIVDGIVSSIEKVDSLQKSEIKNMTVMKGFSQAVIIKTNKAQEREVAAVVEAEKIYSTNDSTLRGTIRIIKSEDGRPLVLVKRDTGKYEKVDDIKKIESAGIKSMSVIKSSSDAKITFGEYGDTSHGVILIELK